MFVKLGTSLLTKHTKHYRGTNIFQNVMCNSQMKYILKLLWYFLLGIQTAYFIQKDYDVRLAKVQPGISPEDIRVEFEVRTTAAKQL